MQLAQPDNADAVVFFNRPDESYDRSFVRFLEKAKEARAAILPVAATKEQRQPPAVVQDKQSFDVVEQLRQRALDTSQVATAAAVFSRQVLSILKPTFSVEPMHLFLSYRRFDGEEISVRFNNALITSHQQSFRDLFDIRVGEDAQEVIEERIRESDAVIFLDTPKTGESPWITKELETALSLQLPIVWIRIGPEASRVPLKIKPLGEAHFNYPDLDMEAGAIPASAVDKIVQMAFDIHHRDYVDRLVDEIGKLTDLSRQAGFKLDIIDSRRMIYTLTLPRKPGRYRERKLTHVLQFFGRTPTKDDINGFSSCITEVGYEPHPKHGDHYDSAILLAAIPSRTSASCHECGVHTDSIGDYVSEIQRETTPNRATKKRLVISGAFADCEPEFQQNMTNAVHAITETCLRAGAEISFGAHPTFQFMIFDLAKRLRPRDFHSAVRMYISLFFATRAMVEELNNSAEVIPVDAVGEDRARSLTAMRQAMLNDSDACALVVIGGKTSRGGHSPGVDEEIQLARKSRLPVYIIGSVGGRSSELCASMPPAERAAINRLSEADNSELGVSLDYSRLAKLILDASF
jgi:hypothetical protein